MENKTIAEFWQAFNAMQGEIDDVQKSGTNEAFKRGGKASTYATLEDVLSMCRPVWSKHGLSIVQNCTTAYHDTRVAVKVSTIIAHKAGHVETFDGLEILATKLDAHGIASAVTYGRRIAIMAALGITGSDDDDGNGAAGVTAGNGQPKPLPQKPEQKPAKPSDPNQIKPITQMTQAEIKSEFEGYKFTSEQNELMRLANITSMRDAIEKRRQHESNEAMVKSIGGEGAQ